MDVGLRIFRTKVARRVFIVFVLVALVPLTATALLALDQIGQALTITAQQQLRDASRGYGQMIYRRLELANGVLARLVSAPYSPASQAQALPEFASLALLEARRLTQLYGETVIDHAESLNLAADRSSLIVRADSPHGNRLYMTLPLFTDGFLIGEIAPEYLWDQNTLPYELDVCVFSVGDSNALFCTLPLPADQAGIVANPSNPPSHEWAWTDQGEAYHSAYWELFTPSGFDSQPWRILASQPDSIALAALISFKRVFPIVLLIVLLAVLLLSIWQIRRSMVPLGNLVAGTRRIANRQFDTRIALEGHDEFAELADAMNTMADRLGRQFVALNTLSEIDRLILSAAELEQVIQTALAQTRSILLCEAAGLMLLDTDSPELGRLYFRRHDRQQESAALTRIPASEEQLQILRDASQGDFIDPKEIAVLSEFARIGLAHVLVFPILIRKEFAGALVFGVPHGQEVAAESRLAARDLADRLAVALSASEREAVLFNQAHFDALTGLPNRELCRDRLSQALARARRDEQELAVLFLDLDKFKVVNDSLGHSAGDALLREVAARIRTCVRETDTVARLGGDEFVIVLPRIIGVTETETVAKSIMATLQRPICIEDKEVFVTVSIGVTLYPHDGDTVEGLLRKADAAMYDAKAAGRSRYVFFANEIEERATERLNLESDLRTALERGELELRYQPQLDLGSDEISSVEALLRWAHPRRGQASPGLFVPILEEMGLIEVVGGWVLSTAIAQLKAWQADGVALRRVAVNVSARQLRQQNFAEKVIGILNEHGVSPTCLELEITESVFLEDMELSNESLRRLRESGVLVSIDDFGTGYSSFSYLRDLQFDAVKIDQAFICDIPDRRAIAITKAILAVAKTLGKSVIAEGVEKDIQLARLRSLGCDAVQGFLISRPLTAADLAHWLAKRAAGEDLSPSFIARALA